jgi:hypothetical protein
MGTQREAQNRSHIDLGGIYLRQESGSEQDLRKVNIVAWSWSIRDKKYIINIAVALKP